MHEEPALTLIGTGHVFQIEDTIRDAILALRPAVVFVELDRGRLSALLHRRRTGEAPPVRGSFVQRKLAMFQEQVAKRYGGEVGGEMVAAVEAAGMVGARVLLIDRPAQVTVQRALKELTWREKGRALGLVIGGGFRALVPSKRPDIDDEVRKYQADSLASLAELQGRFPTVHRVVIHERDLLMADRIRKIMEDAPSGLAVVGDGHIPGMLEQLSDLSPRVFRLSEVRAGTLPKPTAFGVSDDGNSASFGFEP